MQARSKWKGRQKSRRDVEGDDGAGQVVLALHLQGDVVVMSRVVDEEVIVDAVANAVDAQEALHEDGPGVPVGIGEPVDVGDELGVVHVVEVGTGVAGSGSGTAAQRLAGVDKAHNLLFRALRWQQNGPGCVRALDREGQTQCLLQEYSF